MFTAISPAYYLVIDLEATCADDGTVPKDEMETIEIGAVLVNTGSLEPVDDFQTFIHPVRHPELTAFCTRLTSISQEAVSEAPSFPEALEALVRWVGSRQALFCSWGDYDRRQFLRDCTYHEIAYPFGDAHLNLRVAFSHRQRFPRKLELDEAMLTAELELKGVHHRGIDDARNIAQLLPFIVLDRTVPDLLALRPSHRDGGRGRGRR